MQRQLRHADYRLPAAVRPKCAGDPTMCGAAVADTLARLSYAFPSEERAAAIRKCYHQEMAVRKV